MHSDLNYFNHSEALSFLKTQCRGVSLCPHSLKSHIQSALLRRLSGSTHSRLRLFGYLLTRNDKSRHGLQNMQLTLQEIRLFQSLFIYKVIICQI